MAAARIGELVILLPDDDFVVIPVQQDRGGVLYLLGSADPDNDTPFVRLPDGVAKLIRWSVDNHPTFSPTPASAPAGGAAAVGLSC